MNYILIISNYQSSSDEMIGKIVIGAVGFLLIYALSRLFRKKASKNNRDQSLTSTSEDKIQDVNPANPNITEKNDKFKSQKEALRQLKEENCLTDKEYEEKLRIVYELEKKEKVSLEEELINQKVKSQIEPILNKLNNLLESELLTQDEYDAKIKQLFIDRKKQMLDQISTNGELKRIDYDQLSDVQKNKVKNLFQRPKYGGIILVELLDDNIWSATGEEYIELKLDKNNNNRFKYVVLPDNFKKYV